MNNTVKERSGNLILRGTQQNLRSHSPVSNTSMASMFTGLKSHSHLTCQKTHVLSLSHLHFVSEHQKEKVLHFKPAHRVAYTVLYLYRLTIRPPRHLGQCPKAQTQLSTCTTTVCASSQDFYVASSACNRLIARCKSTLASVSEIHSRFSCICFAISCRRSDDER
jgi:hypothetical protein